MPIQLRQLLNPYNETGRENLVRVQLWVSPEDKFFLQSVYPVKGVETFMLASLFKNLCAELRAAGITHFSVENAEYAYALIQRHVAPLKSAGERPLVDDEGRSCGVHRTRKTPKNKPANVG